MKESLLDTDTLSFFFRGDAKVIERANQYLNDFDYFHISVITFYEIMAGLTFKKAERQIKEFEEFVANNHILYITEESARISSVVYSDLRQKGITIGTSDILIAGIAIENGLTLITNNEKHYEPIEGLRIENWKS